VGRQATAESQLRNRAVHYYQFNIGDYASHTKGLSLLEDLAYRRLMDEYYLNEHMFNGCSTDVARCIGMRDHQEDVDYILNRYFQKDGDSWSHKRIESEIKAYKGKLESKSKAGKASAEARKHRASEQVLNPVEQTNNHKPITNIHKPIINKGGFQPPTLQEVRDYCIERGNGVDVQSFINHYEANDWVRGKTKIKDWKACVRTWETKMSVPTQHQSCNEPGKSKLERIVDRSWSDPMV